MTTEELKKTVAWEFERKIAAEMAGGENTEAYKAYVRLFGPQEHPDTDSTPSKTKKGPQ